MFPRKAFGTPATWPSPSSFWKRIPNWASNRLLGVSSGITQFLTGTQVTALLDTFTSGAKGLAPASGGGTTNFLRADGSWAAPASSGAPVDATYVVVSLNGTLTNERRIQGTAGRLTLTDGGAGGDLTLDVGSSVYVAGGTDVAVADGGTGLSSYTAGDLLYASGSTTLSKLAAGSSGQVLTQGAGPAPVWASLETLLAGLGLLLVTRGGYETTETDTTNLDSSAITVEIA